MPRRLLGAMLLVVTTGTASRAFTVSSPAFAGGKPIPREHTCDGADRSPALAWADPPAGTKALAVIADDPDAPRGTWVHWVLYDLPPDATGLPAGVEKIEQLASGARHGANDFRRVGYGGPCPPPGKPHRYVFRVYALDAPTGLPARATKSQLLTAIQGHVLGQAELVGTYGRE